MHVPSKGPCPDGQLVQAHRSDHHELRRNLVTPKGVVGGNDRTHKIRVPDHNRVELRAGDGSANPYLAAAATIAAGLDGIRRELDPGETGRRIDVGFELPMTLLHAMDALAADPVVTGALNSAGADVAGGTSRPSSVKSSSSGTTR